MKDRPKLLVEDDLTPTEQKVYVKMERWMTSVIRTPADAQRVHDKLGDIMDRMSDFDGPWNARNPHDVLFSLWAAADHFKGDACGYARDSIRFAARKACMKPKGERS